LLALRRLSGLIKKGTVILRQDKNYIKAFFN